MTNLLNISQEKFEQGYNVNFMPFIQEDYNGQSYLPWSIVFRLLKQIHPNLAPFVYSIDEIPVSVSLAGVIESTVNKAVSAQNKKVTKMLKEFTSDVINNPLPDLTWDVDENYISSLVHMSLPSVNEESYVTKVLNVAVKDMTTGAISFSLQYPVMDKRSKTNGAAKNPDTRQINDATMRAFVKVIASVTGIGLRLWTREGLDDADGNPTMKSRLLKRLVDVEETYLENNASLPECYETPSFAHSAYKLKQFGKMLTSTGEEAQGEEMSMEQAAWVAWQRPKDAIDYATSNGWEQDEAKELFKSIKADDNKERARLFYEQITTALTK